MTTARFIAGDCRSVLATLGSGSVHVVVTSPPYWGLRDYGTATWRGGDKACDHARSRAGDGPKQTQGAASGHAAKGDRLRRDGCAKCGAVRVDAQIGLEASPAAYVAELVSVFREVRRVLRDDGTVFLNLGDSYATGAGKARSPGGGSQGKRFREYGPGGECGQPNRMPLPGLKPKDLIGIPWRVALALQADGWWLRSDIIWSKPNPMPESVLDRPTIAHEHVFMLSKSARYFFDRIAVHEPVTGNAHHRGSGLSPKTVKPGLGIKANASFHAVVNDVVASRNTRTVWSIGAQPFRGGHFAAFPVRLAERCIKAGSSEHGCCEACGAPWIRVVRRKAAKGRRSGNLARFHVGGLERGRLNTHLGSSLPWDPTSAVTEGWRRPCSCNAALVPCVVLDPFSGVGTTGLAAAGLGRESIGIDLNPAYVVMAEDRVAAANRPAAARSAA